MFNIVEEKVSSYNADGKTVTALVAYDDYGNCVSVARRRAFENRRDWEARLVADAAARVAA